jgi:potassium-transporting ATPase KdpC subunit
MLTNIKNTVIATILFAIVCCGIYPVLVWGAGQLLFSHQANGSLILGEGGKILGSELLGQPFSSDKYFHPRPSAAGTGYDASNSSGANLGPTSDKLVNGAISSVVISPATKAADWLAFDGLRLRTIHYAVENGIAFKLYTVAADGSRTEVPLSKYQDAQGNLDDVALVNAFPHADDKPEKTPLVADNFAALIPADAVTASGSGLDPHISVKNALIQAARVAKARNLPQADVEAEIHKATDGPSLGVFGDPGVNVLKLNLALDSKQAK